MRKLLKYVLCLLLVMTVADAHAGLLKKKKEGYQKAYVFGFASSFTDSVAYLTDVQEMDSAYIMSKGFIADRSLYSLQLFAHVNEKLGMEYPTTAFFFSTNAKKAAKKYQKVKSMYMANNNVKLAILSQDDFRFKPEEYMEVLITETEEGLEETATDKKSKKAKKEKSKKGDRPEMPGGMPPGGMGMPPGGMGMPPGGMR